jgi:hypothetical protein
MNMATAAIPIKRAATYSHGKEPDRDLRSLISRLLRLDACPAKHFRRRTDSRRKAGLERVARSFKWLREIVFEYLREFSEKGRE